MDKNKTLTPAQHDVVQAAMRAQQKIAAIARTRRPTEAETAEANAAYAAAAKVTR